MATKALNSTNKETAQEKSKAVSNMISSNLPASNSGCSQPVRTVTTKVLNSTNMETAQEKSAAVSSMIASNFSGSCQHIEKNQNQLIQNESYITYAKLEIEKLEKTTIENNERRCKLEEENKMLEETLKDMTNSNNISRESILVKRNTFSILKEGLSSFEAELNEHNAIKQKVYNKHLDKYNKIKASFENHHPLFKRLKALQLESSKLEIQKKMLFVKVEEKKKQLKQHAEIANAITHSSITNFARATLEYWSGRELSTRIKAEEQKKAELLKKLHEIKLAAGKKEQMSHKKHLDGSEMLTDEAIPYFMSEQSWKKKGVDNRITNVAVPVSMAPSSIYDSNIILRDKQLQSEKHLSQMRARFDILQQHRLQNALKLPEKRPLHLPSLSLKKKKNLEVDTFKNPLNTATALKTSVVHPVKKAKVQNLSNSNSKINIISVDSIENQSEIKHQMYPISNINKNKTLQHPMALVNYPKTQARFANTQNFQTNNLQTLENIPKVSQDTQNRMQNKMGLDTLTNVGRNIGLYSQKSSGNLETALINSQEPKQSQTNDLSSLQNSLASSQRSISSQEKQLNNNLNKDGADAFMKTSQNDNVIIPSQIIPTLVKEGAQNLEKPNQLASKMLLQRASNMGTIPTTSPFFNNVNDAVENTTAKNKNDSIYLESLSYSGDSDINTGYKLDGFSPMFSPPSGNPDNSENAGDPEEPSNYGFNYGQAPIATNSATASFFGGNACTNSFNMF